MPPVTPVHQIQYAVIETICSQQPKTQNYKKNYSAASKYVYSVNSTLGLSVKVENEMNEVITKVKVTYFELENDLLITAKFFVLTILTSIYPKIKLEL